MITYNLIDSATKQNMSSLAISFNLLLVALSVSFTYHQYGVIWKVSKGTSTRTTVLIPVLNNFTIIR